MRLYYSVPDVFPAFRVDVSELFGRELTRLGVAIEWFMYPGRPLGDASAYEGQVVHVPPQLGGGERWRQIVNRLLVWAADAAGVLRAARRRDVDAVQCRDKFLVSALGVLACRLYGKPFFYWCSYLYPEHHRHEGRVRGGWRGALQRLKGSAQHLLLYRFVMPLSTHVFVQSEQMRRDLAAHGVPPKHMTPIPMGVPQRLLDWAATHRPKVAAGTVVYLGALGAVRRLDVLLHAFARIARQRPDVRLVMVGDGDYPDERRALQDQAVALGLADRIVFTGFVPMAQAWQIAATGAVCVSPIYPTPFMRSASPTKLIEYMALGRPVVCNDHPDQSAIARASGAAVCVPWGEREFARAIAALLDEPAVAEAMGARGPAWVAQHRIYTELAQQVLARYCIHCGEPS